MANPRIYDSEALFNKHKKRERKDIEKAMRLVLQETATFNPISSEDYVDLQEASRIIAGHNPDKITDLVKLTSETVFLQSKQTNFSKPKYSQPPAMKETYETLYNKGFFDRLFEISQNGTSKTQTGKALIDNTIELNEKNNIQFSYTKTKNVASLNRIVEAADKIKELLDNEGLIATFDTETVGAENAYGYHELLGMTEFSFTPRRINKVTGAVEEVDPIRNLIGLSEEEHKTWITKLEGMRNNKELSGSDRVSLSRWSKAGHPDTGIEKIASEASDGAAWRHSSFTDKNISSLDQEIKYSIEGVNRYRTIGIAQEAAAAKDGYMLWEKQFGQMVDIMNSGKTGIVGFNDTSFDIPMMNRIMARTPSLKNKHIEVPKDYHFDMLQALRTFTQSEGTNAMYKGNDKWQERMTEGLTSNTQEMFTRFFNNALYEDGGIAHVAEFDERALFSMFTQPAIEGKPETVFDVIHANLKKMQETTMTGKYTGPNQELFLVNQSNMFGNFNRTGGLNFTYDTVSKSFKTANGYEIGKEGVKNVGRGQTGTKKKALYSYNVVKFDTTEEFRELFNVDLDEASQATMQEYGVGSMYAVIASPVYDRDAAMEKIGHTLGMDESIISIVHSQEQVEGLLNSGINFGKIKPGLDAMDPMVRNNLNNWDMNIEAMKHPDVAIKEMVTDANDKLKVTTYQPTMEDVFDISMQRTTNDPAANLARTMNYSKYKKTKGFLSEFDAVMEETAGANKDEKLATMISKNQPLTLQFQEVLGYNDFSFSEGNKRLQSNTLKNTLYVRDYLESMSPLMDGIEQAVEELIPHNGEGDIPKDIKYRRNMAFNQGVTTALESLSQNKQEIINGVPTKTFASDLNFVQFSKSFLFNEATNKTVGGTLANDTDDFINVNFENGYGLLSSLYNKDFRDSKNTSAQKAAGYDRLNSFYKKVNSLPEYRGAFAGFNIEDFQNKDSHLLSSEITDRLRSHTRKMREKSPEFGFLDRSVFTQNSLDPHKLVVGASKDSMANAIGAARNTIKNAPQIKLLGYDEEGLGDSIDLLTNLMMPLKRDNYMKSISQFNSVDQKTYMANFDLAHDAMKKKATDILKGVAGSDLTLAITGDKEHQLALLNSGKQEFINLPKVGTKNGVLFTNIDGNRHIIQPHLDMSNIVGGGTFKTGGPRYISSVEKAYNESISFESSLKNAMKNNKDSSEQFISTLSRHKKTLRESSPRIGFINAQVMQEQLEQNINDVVRALPEIYNDPMYNELKQSGLIGENLEVFLKRIINFDGPLKDRISKIEDMSSTERNAFMEQGLIPILQRMGMNMDDPITKHFLENATTATKDTHITQGKIGTGSYLLGALNAFNNTARPPVTQFQNFQYYNKERLEAELKRQKIDSGVSLKPLFTDPKSESFMTNVIDDVSGESFTSTINAKHITIDNNSLRAIVAKEKGKKNSVFREKAASLGYNEEGILEIQRLLEDKAMHANLYEQEIVIDSRLHDAVFNKMELQKISSNKQIELLHENDLATLEQLKTFRKTQLVGTLNKDKTISYSYSSGKRVSEKDHLFRTSGYSGATDTYVAKYDGMFKGGYFNNFGELVDEKTLEKKVKSAESLEQAEKILNGIYSFDYYVLPQNEHYGSKIFQDTGEKGVANAMKSALGSVNPEVAREIKAMGLEDELGKIHYKGYLDSQLFPQIRANAGSAAEATRIINMIEDERHIMGDIMFRGIDDLNKGARFLINQNIKGHENYAIPIKSAISELNAQGKLDENIIKIFGIEGVEFKDGQIHLPSDVNNSFIDVRMLKEIMKDKEVDIEAIRDKDGKFLGSVGYSDFTQVLDYSGGTHKGVGNEKQLYKKIESEQKILEGLRKKALNNDDSQLHSQMLEQENKILEMRERIAAEKHIDRGLKYSDRTHGLLNRMRYDDDYIENLRTKLSAEDFQNITKGLVDADGRLLDSKRGESVLSPVTNRMKDILLTGDNELQIKDIAGDAHLTKQYGYLSDISNKNMSIKKAEIMYSMGAGTRAQAFNENPTATDAVYQLLNDEKYDFKSVGIKDLALDVKGQAATIRGNENNPYSQNVLLDIGQEFGDNRFLAIGRSIDRQSGDSLIKESHVQKLATLKTQITDYHDNKGDSSEQERIKENISRTINTIKKQQKEDMTSKEGLAGDLIELRMNQSHLGKGSGLTMDLGGYSYEDFQGKLSIDQRKRILGKNNTSILNKAQFEGKSIMDHYAENKIFDVQFRSTKAFEDMGYFDDDLLSRRLNIDITDANRGQAKKDMMDILEKHGDIGLTTRFPEIQEGSVKPSMIYLNRHLADNQAEALGATGLSMKLDYDGDNYFATSLSSKSGETYLDYVLKNGNVSQETRDMVNSSKVYMTGRAVGQNRYYENAVHEALKKDYKRSEELIDIDKLTDGALIDGKVYSAYSTAGANSELATSKRINNVKQYLEQAQGLDGQDFNNKVVDLIKIDHGDTDNAKSLIADFAVERKYDALRRERVSKILKTTIGEANVTNYKMRKIYDSFGDSKAADFNLKGSILQEIVYEAEEGIISSKKMTGDMMSIPADRAEIWNKSLNNVLSGRDVEKSLTDMDDWMKVHLKGKLAPKADFLSNVYSSFKNPSTVDEKEEMMRGMLINTMREMSSSDGIKKVRSSLNFGESGAGLTGKAMDSLYIAATANTFGAEILKTASEEGFIRNLEVLDDLKSKSSKALSSKGLEQIDGREWLRKESSTAKQTGDMLRSVGGAIGNIASGFDGKSLALGAMGIAGAFMVAGFVGGNPSAPSDTQAHEVSEDQFYDIPSLQDQDLSMVQNSKQGYVININARSAKGKQHVQEAIQMAMQNSLSTDVNIAMNINEQAGNISNRDIERLLSGALR